MTDWIEYNKPYLIEIERDDPRFIYPSYPLPCYSTEEEDNLAEKIYVEEYNRVYELEDEYLSSNCFLHSKFNKPGVLIQTLDNHGVEHTFLIGHISTEPSNSGFESDIINFNHTVLRYKVVYTP